MARLFCLLALCVFTYVTVARSQGISWITTSTNDTSIYTYNFNSGSALLASYNFPALALKASAINKNSGQMYLIMKDIKARSYIVRTLDLATGTSSSVTLQQLPSASLEYSDSFVDNNGDLLAIVQDTNLYFVFVFSVNVSTGVLTQLSALPYKSNIYFVSSSFFTNTNTYVGLFTSLDNARSHFLVYSVDSNTWSMYDAPNGLAAIAANSNSGQLVGVLTNAPPGWTQLVNYNYGTGNTTYIGTPLTAQNYAYCGSARGAMSQGMYFVACCTDPLCLQGSMVYSNNLQNNNMNLVTKIGSPVTFGLYAM